MNISKGQTGYQARHIARCKSIAETGEILEVKSPQKTGAGLTYRDAGTKAIKQCGDDMADDLIWNIPLHVGASEKKTIQLLVNSLAYSDYSKLTGELKNMRSVTHVFPRGWERMLLQSMI